MTISKKNIFEKIFVYTIHLKRLFRSSAAEIGKYYKLGSKQIILVDGYAESPNFGDGLNVPLIEYLSGKKVLISKFLPPVVKRNNDTNAVIGSILQWSKDNCVVWGAGYISDQNIKIVRPKKTLAVRGPLTRKIFLDHNIDCPEVYGDPALLLPLIYNPKTEKKYEIGFIPHFVNKKSEYITLYQNNTNCLVLDILKRVDYNVFIDQILSCKYIVTSSLHGLIMAHSYQIPVLWVQYSVDLIGGRFKFDDYLQSVNKQHINPFYIDQNYTIEQYIALMDTQKITYDYIPLIDSCPFICKTAKDEILEKLEQIV